MEEDFPIIEQYAEITVCMVEYPDIRYEGQFRGRIKDSTHCVYDNEGSAIWVTLNNGFEFFAEIGDISSILYPI